MCIRDRYKKIKNTTKFENHNNVSFLSKLFMNWISLGIQVTYSSLQYSRHTIIYAKNSHHVSIVLTLATIKTGCKSFEPEHIVTNIFKILQFDKSFKENKTANDKLFILFDSVYEEQYSSERFFNTEYYQIKGNNIVSNPTILRYYN